MTITDVNRTDYPSPKLVDGIEYPFYDWVGIAESMDSKDRILAESMETAFIMLSRRLGIVEHGEALDPSHQPHAFYRHPDIETGTIEGLFEQLRGKLPEHFNPESPEIRPIGVFICQVTVDHLIADGGIVSPLKRRP